MPQVISRRVLSADAADVVLNGPDGLLSPRSDIVLERATGEASLSNDEPSLRTAEAVFTAVEGPVEHYRRTVTTEPLSDSRVQITEQFDYRLAIPVWWVLFTIPFSRALRQGRDWPWWHPPDRFTARQARIVALLATLAVIAGFLGTLLGQTITFARDEFGESKSAAGFALSLIRLSILITVAVAALADRKGRRRTLLYAAFGAILASAATSLVANLATLTAVQAVSRGLSHAMALLIFVFALEEAPSGSRAFVASMLGLAAGLGSGIAVGSVPLADLGVTAWRLSFLVALAGLPLVLFAARRLPESQRFETARRQPRTKPPTEYRFRLVLLAVTSFAVLVFASPASQLQNDFLRDERGFSATKITIFTLLTAWTAGPGMLIAGKLADLRGRRVLASIGVSGGALFALWHFTLAGWPMWILIAVGTFMTATTVPTLGVYRAEMFGTMRRSESNGILGMAGVAGSAAGLAAAGVMADAWGYGTAFTVLVAGPILVAILVLVFYPETTRRSLEELNPEDA
ncbi:MAG: MFS transporter [bacterium]|nr:MFS transporter [bacterium]MYB08355.1 MFS transporter [Acidimicrobiia bacterium]MYG59476.1 MFS transporter [Acidimicrobiia bacterium]MYJ31560.1 MFS transporter [Acidimicrobiia bacterium]